MDTRKQEAKRYGKLIADARRRCGMKQIELSKLTGLSPTHLSHIESGKRMPSLPNASKIYKALGQPLFEGESQPYTAVVKLFDGLCADDKRLVLELMIRLQPT